MRAFFFHHWRLAAFFVIFGVALLPETSLAADANGQLFFRPHCTQASQELCPTFTTLDPRTLVTPALGIGDTLDVDLVFLNTPNVSVQRIRAWVAYDPSVLQGQRVKLGSGFTIPTPGEADFDPAHGYVKIQGSNTVNVTGAQIPFAELTFTVKSIPAGNLSAISLYDLKADITGHTFVVSSTDLKAVNQLARDQGSLRIMLKPAAIVSSAASSIPISGAPLIASSAPATLPESSSISSAMSAFSSTDTLAQMSNASSVEPTRTSFILLQIQNVTITTDGSTVYLAWDNLRSSELAGYNIYYGSKSGQYMQRKSLTPDETTLAVRGLTPGTTLYFAVRGVNRAGEESAFSQEVAVKVGDPATSTSPMARPGDTVKAPKNPVTNTTKTPVRTMPGEAGLPSPILILLLISAAIGTIFAFRRQWSIPRSSFPF